MAHKADESGLIHVPRLVKVSDSGFGVKSRESDIRRLGVFNQNGDQIGSIEDLYVDTQEREVRYLEVGAGGFMGARREAFPDPGGGGHQLPRGRGDSRWKPREEQRIAAARHEDRTPGRLGARRILSLALPTRRG